MIALELGLKSPLCPPYSPFFKGGSFSAAFPSLAKRGRGDFCAERGRELFDELCFQDTSLILVQVQSKSDRFIDSLDLFRREGCDSLFDQDFRQSGNIIQIDHATSRHSVTAG